MRKTIPLLLLLLGCEQDILVPHDGGPCALDAGMAPASDAEVGVLDLGIEDAPDLGIEDLVRDIGVRDSDVPDAYPDAGVPGTCYFRCFSDPSLEWPDTECHLDIPYTDCWNGLVETDGGEWVPGGCGPLQPSTCEGGCGWRNPPPEVRIPCPTD